MALVIGVGVYERGFYTSGENGTHTKEYLLWKHVLQRCYSKRVHEVSPSYVGCTISENFKDFQYFAQWCNDQVGFGIKGWQLDKDILVKGNKVYSENTCCFVPKEINLIMVNNCSGESAGVTKYYNKFKVSISMEGERKYLGLFTDRQVALSTYREAKESQIKVLAERYKDRLDPRVHSILSNYKIATQCC